MPRKKKERKLIAQIKKHKKTFAIYVILRFLVILVLIHQVLNQNYENVFFCVLTLCLFLIPSLVEMKLKVEVPDALQITVLLFIFVAEILGEIQNFYGIFTHFDIILHTINGFLCAAIGFSVIDILNQSNKFHLNLSPLFVAIFGFTFSMTIGVLWEFFEYSADRVFHSDMQKDTLITEVYSTYLNENLENKVVSLEDIDGTLISTSNGEYVIDGYLDIGLNDTMEDLFVNFIGAVVFSTIGYIYVKKRKTNKFMQGFIMEFRG